MCEICHKVDYDRWVTIDNPKFFAKIFATIAHVFPPVMHQKTICRYMHQDTWYHHSYIQIKSEHEYFQFLLYLNLMRMHMHENNDVYFQVFINKWQKQIIGNVRNEDAEANKCTFGRILCLFDERNMRQLLVKFKPFLVCPYDI